MVTEAADDHLKEVEYWSGAVVRLGREMGVEAKRQNAFAFPAARGWWSRRPPRCLLGQPTFGGGWARIELILEAIPTLRPSPPNGSSRRRHSAFALNTWQDAA
jgi:hypothetical protein